jgi:hypothetical protein
MLKRQRALDGAQSRLMVLAQHGDHKRSNRQRCRVIASARYHGASVPDPGGFVGLAEPGSREEYLMAMSEERMGGGVVRVQPERVLQKPRCYPRVCGHRSRHFHVLHASRGTGRTARSINQAAALARPLALQPRFGDGGNQRRLVVVRFVA